MSIRYRKSKRLLVCQAILGIRRAKKRRAAEEAREFADYYASNYLRPKDAA